MLRLSPGVLRGPFPPRDPLGSIPALGRAMPGWHLVTPPSQGPWGHGLPPGKLRHGDPPEQHPRSPHTMGTWGDAGTGSATHPPYLKPPRPPPAQRVLDTLPCPGHPPQQLLGCQHPDSPELLQASPTQPPGSCRAPQQPPAPVGTCRLQSAAGTSSLIPQ